jgi:hypothetical protein
MGHWRTFSNVFKWLHCGSTVCSKSLILLENFSYIEIKRLAGGVGSCYKSLKQLDHLYLNDFNDLAGGSTSWCKSLISLADLGSMTYTVRFRWWMKSSWWWNRGSGQNGGR